MQSYPQGDPTGQVLQFIHSTTLSRPDPLMQKIRYFGKLVDELAKGKAMEEILRPGPATSA
jgi:hypothetical protein